jgi:hypothetical protein
VSAALRFLGLVLYGAGAASSVWAPPQRLASEQRLSEVAVQAVRNAEAAAAGETLRASRVPLLEDAVYAVLCPDPLLLPARVSPVAFFGLTFLNTSFGARLPCLGACSCPTGCTGSSEST